MVPGGLNIFTFFTARAYWSRPYPGFLPCDAMRCTVFVIVILSACLSVRPSVTLVDCVHMVRPTIMISSPHGSPIILVSGDITSIPKFEGGHPQRGRWMRVGWVRIGDFRPISRRLRNGARYIHTYIFSFLNFVKCPCNVCDVIVPLKSLLL